jgi:hypothetical protein
MKTYSFRAKFDFFGIFLIRDYFIFHISTDFKLITHTFNELYPRKPYCKSNQIKYIVAITLNSIIKLCAQLFEKNMSQGTISNS